MEAVSIVMYTASISSMWPIHHTMLWSWLVTFAVIAARTSANTHVHGTSPKGMLYFFFFFFHENSHGRCKSI